MSIEPARSQPEGMVSNFAYRTIDNIGRAISLLVFVLIAILLFGVIMRYLIDVPSIWVSELSGMIYAVYFLVGGSYALIHNDHVNVNIFREHLSLRSRAWLDLLTWSLFYIMIGTIFWLGIDYAKTSIERLETSSTVWGPYIWPVKLAVPVAAFLMLVAGAIKTLGDIRAILSKHSPPEDKAHLQDLDCD